MQKKIMTRYATVVMALMLTACNDAYEGFIHGPGNDYPYPDVDAGGILINPSLTDGDALVVTRGAGSFEEPDPNVNKAQWESGQFRMWAFRTPNKLQTGSNTKEADFTSNDANDCLLNNQPMHVKMSAGAMALTFDDKQKHYYNAAHAEYRYKFFCNHIDEPSQGMRDGEPRRTRTQVTQDLELDGTRDVMIGFAYHTNQLLDDHLRSITADDATRVLATNRHELLYSTISAARGLQPRVVLKHALCNFDVQVQGCETTEGRSFENILITRLWIEGPHKGTATLADEAWNDSTTFRKAYEGGQLFKVDPTSKAKMQAKVLRDDFGDFNMAPARVYDIPNMSSQWVLPEKTHHVKSTAKARLCDYMVLPPFSQYVVYMEYLFLNRNNEKQVDPASSLLLTSIYNLKLADGRDFLPGHKYTILLQAYGPQQINFTVVEAPTWEEGGEIPIDPDES